MSKIDELIREQEGKELIATLKAGRATEVPNVDDGTKALDISQHKVNDKTHRPDKKIAVDNGVGGTTDKVEKVNRIALALQKKVISLATAFLFGNPVEYESEALEGDLSHDGLVKAFNRVLKAVKVNAIDRKIAKTVFSFKECAEFWFPLEQKEIHKTYGFPTKFKIKTALFSPAFGDTLYPYYDEYGDMIAFSRAYERTIGKEKVSYFETYTDTAFYRWEGKGEELIMAEGYPKVNPLGKIPIVYAYQDYYETQDVDSLIERLETLLSNFADTNDYHASPKIFVKGELIGFAKKGESGAILQGGENTEASYLSWANAPESVKLEIETLLKLIYTLTQTPDISFDSVKGLGSLSGVALKLLFMDAHLKVQDKRVLFDDYLQRRANLIKAFLVSLNPQFKGEAENVSISPSITPYMITSEKEELDYWLTASGNKPVISQEEAVAKAGLSDNAQKTMELIKAEASSIAYNDTFEPTI